MVKPVYWGTIDCDCDKILALMSTKAHPVDVGTERDCDDYDGNEYDNISKYYDKDEIRYKRWCYEWESLIPDAFFTQTKIKKEPITAVVIEVLPGKVTPPHVDNYEQLPWKQQVDERDIARFWITVTKPTLGHALFFDEEVCYNLPQGTIVEIPQGAEHSACNAGDTSRVYMSIIGVRDRDAYSCQWKKDED